MNNKIKEFIEKYEICDAHCHIFPDKISEKAVAAIGDFYDISMDGNGSAGALLESGKTIGVKKYLVCSTATVPHQVESINRFISQTCRNISDFVGFGSLHPDYSDSHGQIEYCLSENLKGIKLHPDFQKFNIDDKSAYHIYDAAQSSGLPILFHVGDNRYDFSSPTRLKRMLRDFPKLKVIAAHFGGYRQWDEAVTNLGKNENVYFDTSSSLMFITPESARNMINKYSSDRMFFGSDFPMWKHYEELSRFINLNLSDRDNEKILSSNFKRFFSLTTL